MLQNVTKNQLPAPIAPEPALPCHVHPGLVWISQIINSFPLIGTWFFVSVPLNSGTEQPKQKLRQLKVMLTDKHIDTHAK